MSPRDSQVSNDPVRTLVLAKGFPPTSGGIEQYSLQVAQSYLRSGHRVLVMTQTEAPRGWQRVATDDGELLLWNAGPGNQIQVFARMVVAALRDPEVRKIRQVHSTSWRVGAVAALISRGAKKVVTVHGREVLNVPQVLRWAMHYVFRSADVVISVSQATEAAAHTAVQVDQKRWFVQHNGLSYRDDAESFERGRSDDGLRILSLSRLVPRKNVDVTIRAFAVLQSLGFEKLQLRIAGTGPERPRLEDLISQLGLGSNVELLGYVDDAQIPELYKWANVFMHPHTHIGQGSDFEGFGLVIADAMSFGCTPIIGNIGGPRELVTHGETGYLVDGADQEQVSAALQKLADDPALIARLGAAARSHALRAFSWDAHITPALALFDHRNGPVR